MAKENFAEGKVDIRIVLSALWTCVMFFYVYGDYFELYVPGKTAELVNGTAMLNSPTKLFFASLLLAIPAAMIGLTLLAKARLSRLLNLIFGAFYTILMLLIAIISLTPWLTFYVFFAVLESAITVMIFWKAWTWPKQLT